MVNKNYVSMISYSDFENIKRMIYNDIKNSEGLTIFSRAYLNITQNEYDRLERVYGKDNNKNYNNMIFMDKKQQKAVGKDKNILVNLFTCELKEGYRVIENPVTNNIPIFSDESIIIDAVIESCNSSISYIRNLFNTYRDLFERFFPENYAEPLALLSAFECFGGSEREFLDIVWQEEADLIHTHCTEGLLCELLKDTTNNFNNCTYIDGHPPMTIYRNYFEEY